MKQKQLSFQFRMILDRGSNRSVRLTNFHVVQLEEGAKAEISSAGESSGLKFEPLLISTVNSHKYVNI